MKAYAERECCILLAYNEQNVSVRVRFQSNAIFTLFWYSLTMSQITISLRYFSKVSQLFLFSPKRSLNSRQSGTRLFIKWFLIKQRKGETKDRDSKDKMYVMKHLTQA